MDLFRITKGWLESNRTPGGGWNAKQLNQLGINWPPPKGWRKRALTMAVSIERKEEFERLAAQPVKEKVTIQQLERRIVKLENAVLAIAGSCDLSKGVKDGIHDALNPF